MTMWRKSVLSGFGGYLRGKLLVVERVFIIEEDVIFCVFRC